MLTLILTIIGLLVTMLGAMLGAGVVFVRLYFSVRSEIQSLRRDLDQFQLNSLGNVDLTFTDIYRRIDAVQNELAAISEDAEKNGEKALNLLTKLNKPVIQVDNASAEPLRTEKRGGSVLAPSKSSLPHGLRAPLRATRKGNTIEAMPDGYVELLRVAMGGGETADDARHLLFIWLYLDQLTSQGTKLAVREGESDILEMLRKNGIPFGNR